MTWRWKGFTFLVLLRVLFFTVCFGILVLLNWSPRTYTNSVIVPLAHTLARNRKAMSYWWSLLCTHQQNRGHCFWVLAFCGSALVQALSKPQTTISIGNWGYLGALLCKLLKLSSTDGQPWKKAWLLEYLIHYYMQQIYIHTHLKKLQQSFQLQTIHRAD